MGDIPLDPDSPSNLLSEGVREWAAERRQRLIETEKLTLFDLLGGHLSIRRSVLEEVGGFDANFTRGGSFGDEDLDLGVRLVDRYRVVFNPEAISYQRYVVGYATHLRQWYQAGIADVSFARKHPRYAGEVFEQHGASSRAARWLYIPLSRVPGLAHALGWLACGLITRTEKADRRLARRAERLYLRTRDLLYWRGVHVAGGVPRPRPLLVLCYHAIDDLADDPVLKPYALPRAQFERQIASLLDRGYRFIGGNELATFLRGEAGLPRRPVLLTFDDCYEDLLSSAAPFLADRGVPAIAFAVTGLTSNTNEWDHGKGSTCLSLLDDPGLHAAAEAGIEIGAHSRTHRTLPGLSDAELVSETRGAADDIEAKGLPRPRYFAYPHAELDANARDAVEAAGFEAAFAVVPRRFSRGCDPYAVPRVEILREDTGIRFWLKTRVPVIAGPFYELGLRGMARAGLRAARSWASSFPTSPVSHSR